MIPLENPTVTVYKELQRIYDYFNTKLFESQLPSCIITLHRANCTYGYFMHKRFVKADGQTFTDEIAINPQYFAITPIKEVMQTIAHEMCHQWQYHFGKPSRRSYHNKEFAQKMIDIGLMPSSTGKLGGSMLGQQMMDYPIDGGIFNCVCEELMSGDFKLSWFDRFPPKEFKESSQDNNTFSSEPQHSAVYAVLKPQLVATKPSTNKSNRNKYKCECGLQVWGKPELFILCGKCNRELKELF